MPLPDGIERADCWSAIYPNIPLRAVYLQNISDLFCTGDCLELARNPLTHSYATFDGILMRYGSLLTFDADCEDDGPPLVTLSLQILVPADCIPTYAELQPPSPQVSYPRELVRTNIVQTLVCQEQVKSEIILLSPLDIQNTQAGSCVGASNVYLIRFGCTYSATGEWGPLEICGGSTIGRTANTYSRHCMESMCRLNHAVQMCLSRCRINQNNTCSHLLDFAPSEFEWLSLRLGDLGATVKQGVSSFIVPRRHGYREKIKKRSTKTFFRFDTEAKMKILKSLIGNFCFTVNQSPFPKMRNLRVADLQVSTVQRIHNSDVVNTVPQNIQPDEEEEEYVRFPNSRGIDFKYDSVLQKLTVTVRYCSLLGRELEEGGGQDHSHANGQHSQPNIGTQFAVNNIVYKIASQNGDSFICRVTEAPRNAAVIEGTAVTFQRDALQTLLDSYFGIEA